MKSHSFRATPVVWLVITLCAFELLIRLPYLIWVQSNYYSGSSPLFFNFSIYSPSDVIRDGSLIVLMTLLAAAAAGWLRTPPAVPREARARIGSLGAFTYVMGIICIFASILAIRELQLSHLLENLSAKRNLDDLDSGIYIYLLLKISLFSHVIGAIFYLSYLSTHRLSHLIFSIFFILLTIIISAVFSLRAILFVSGFELLYSTYLYRGLNFRKILTYTFPFILFMAAIGALRSIGSEGLSLGESALRALDWIMTTRYFMNIAKVGSILQWQMDHGKFYFLNFSFITEIFVPNEGFSFKEIGTIISREVFGVATSSVTLGFVSEAILSYGVIIGCAFIFYSFFLLVSLERLIISRERFSIIAFFVITKIPILLNSSLGSYVYQVLIETAMLLPVLVGLRWSLPMTSSRQGSLKKPLRHALPMKPMGSS